jgi:hypothetical protein
MNSEILLLAGVISESSCDKCDKKEKIDFFQKRRDGAKTIAVNAKAKGGPAMLTYYHFAAKDPLYKQVLDAIKSDKKEQFFKSKYDQSMSKLHRTKFDEKDFQKLSGELEVWGEALSVLF